MKKNLVLIPGVLCDERVWQRQISYLSPHFSISCLSVSHFKDVEAFLSYALDNVPSRFYLAGHSMGGWLALELLSRIPERIEKLCLLATSADCDNEARSKARMQVLEHFRNEGFEATLPMLMKTYAAKEDNQTELSEMFSAHMSSFVDQQRMLVHRHSCLDLLAKITQETLLLVGDKDPISFDSMQAIATMLPNSRLEILKETGHMLMQEQPDAVNRLLLTFLESGTIANKGFELGVLILDTRDIYCMYSIPPEYHCAPNEAVETAIASSKVGDAAKSECNFFREKHVNAIS